VTSRTCPACGRAWIQPEELPADIGLLWSTAGTRLITKRKAARREPEPAALVELMSYVLMSRSRLVADMWEAKNRLSERDRWVEWLHSERADKELGAMVGEKIRTILNDRARQVQQAENARDRLDHVERRLIELGLAADSSTHEVDRKFAVADQKRALAQVRRLAENITRLVNEAGA
jgi:hypothetical protein